MDTDDPHRRVAGYQQIPGICCRHDFSNFYVENGKNRLVPRLYPIIFGPEEAYEAKLAVPSQGCAASASSDPGLDPTSIEDSCLYSMEDRYDVTAVTESHGSSSGSLDVDVMVVTLKRARRAIENHIDN